MSRAPQWQETPTRVHTARAYAAYGLVSVGPSLLSVGLLAGWSALTGYAIPLVWTFVALMAVRQLTITVVTLLYHRGICHRTVTLHPALEYAMRVWGWLAMAIGTRTWSLTHRIHHAHADTDRDVHSPVTEGHSLWTIGRQSIQSILTTREDRSLVGRLGSDLPSDRLERLIEWDCKRNFGMTGVRFPIVITVITSAWLATGLPLWVAVGAAVFSLPGINLSVFSSTVFLVNGVGHLWGYRNYEGLDNSTNIVRIDLFGLGEAMHNNHHARPGSANLAHRPGEVDPGFWLATQMQKVGLVRELKVRPARQAAAVEPA